MSNPGHTRPHDARVRPPPMVPLWNRLLAAASIAGACGAGLVLSGCTPHIGDHCALNTDCSLQGTRVCDNAQPNGYCTSFNCGPDSCIDNAVCVVLYASVPGCPYNGYESPSRTARSMCLARCQHDSDCRQSDGYVCANPASAPWNGLIIDDNTMNDAVCLAIADFDGGMSVAPGADAAPVCQVNGPVVSSIDASAPYEFPDN